jgi:hypothetical protein
MRPSLNVFIVLSWDELADFSGRTGNSGRRVDVRFNCRIDQSGQSRARFRRSPASVGWFFGGAKVFQPWWLTCIAHGVGRTEAETLAGTAQTASSVLMICTLTASIEEAEVPAIARLAWSGLQIGAQ